MAGPEEPGRAVHPARRAESNPGNFNDHRRALMRSLGAGAGAGGGVDLHRRSPLRPHAEQHLRAWFITPATRMNPNLRYAQAIHGRFTGRGTGIIDTIHLVEVARAIERARRRAGLVARRRHATFGAGSPTISTG